MGERTEAPKPVKRPRGRPRGSKARPVRREVPGKYPCKHCGEILSSPAYKYTCPVSFADGVLGLSSSQKEME
jgi:ribosomal protein L37AE/L43A